MRKTFLQLLLLLICSTTLSQAQQVREGLTRFVPQLAPVLATPEIEIAKQNSLHHPSTNNNAGARSSDCYSLDPVCVATGMSYVLAAGTNETSAEATNPGNEYSCLGSSPNPAWYYFKIGDMAGDVQLTITATNSVDVDFIVWGPFDSKIDAENACGSYSSVVDCSYSAASTEIVDIPNAQPGDVYVLLITNFSNQPSNIVLSGDGNLLDCSALSLVSGSVHTDFNADCSTNGDDVPMPNTLITGGGHWSITDENGNYTLLSSQAGSFPVMQVSTNPLVTQTPCTPNYEANFSILGQDTTGFDFYNQVVLCPYLTVDVSSSMLRRCVRSSIAVEYCNIGFADVENAIVYLNMPEYVSLISTSYLCTLNDNGDYVFNIGLLAAGECGTIYMTDSVACVEGITNLTQCIQASISPNNTCAQNANPDTEQWDNSHVTLSGACNADTTITFTIYNSSDANGNMTDSSRYRIFANGLLVNTNKFKLDGGSSINLQLTADGRSYRLEADQRPGHPTNDHPTITVENCGGISNWNANSLPTNDADSEIEIDCLPIVDSYDPNDKQISPSGVSNSHWVQPNTLFDYVIRFQNTGSASAIKVVVVDTLPAQLDPATLQFGTSSHSYELSVDGVDDRPILIFTFNNINLPDSTSDLLRSQGFLKFKIAAKQVPMETLISNNAYIYFDFNPPIVTNNAWVTIHEFKIDDTPIEVIESETITAIPYVQPSNFRLYPNPGKQYTLLDLGKSYEKVQIKIETINGQVVYNQQLGQKNQVLINTEYLSTGIYFVTIVTDQQNTVLKWVKQ